MAWGKRDDMIVHREESLNVEPMRAALAEADPTGTDTFYVRNHGPVPELDPDTWRLRVDGLADTSLELPLEALRGGSPSTR